MSRIKTYEDLETEEKRLQALLYSHKESIKDSFAATKEGMNPFKKAVGTASKFFARDKTNPMIQFAVDLGVDVLIRRFLLARAGWFTKVVIPFFVRNYSTNFFKQYKESAMYKKVLSMLKNQKKTKGDDKVDGYYTDIYTTGEAQPSAASMP